MAWTALGWVEFGMEGVVRGIGTILGELLRVNHEWTRMGTNEEG
jgi:hypothetical protein